MHLDVKDTPNLKGSALLYLIDCPKVTISMHLIIEETEALTKMILNGHFASLSDAQYSIEDLDHFSITRGAEDKLTVTIKERYTDRAESIFHLINTDSVVIGLNSTSIYKFAKDTLFMYTGDGDAYANYSCFEAEIIRLPYEEY